MNFRFLFYLITGLFFFGCNNYKNIKENKFHYDLFNENSSKKIQTVYSVPAGYSPDKSYPLIVVLHGLGENAEAFAEIWKEACNSKGYVLLSVQGEKQISDQAHYAWGRNAENNILLSIDEIKKIINIDNSGIYLGGFSAGASLANYLSLKYPFQIRGTISISGSFPFEYFEKSLVNKNNKYYLACGEQETEFSNKISEIGKLLKTRSINCKVKLFENSGHTIPKPWKETISEMLSFMKE